MNDGITYLEELSKRNTTTIKDEIIIQKAINAFEIDGKCTNGMVYIKPYNTEPISIQEFGKILLHIFQKN